MITYLHLRPLHSGCHRRMLLAPTPPAINLRGVLDDPSRRSDLDYRAAGTSPVRTVPVVQLGACLRSASPDAADGPLPGAACHDCGVPVRAVDDASHVIREGFGATRQSSPSENQEVAITSVCMWVPGLRNRAPATSIRTVADGRRNAASGVTEVLMGGPAPSIDMEIEEAVIGHAMAWQRAVSPESPGGIAVTDGEARLLRLDFVREVGPKAMEGAHSITGIRKISSGQRGIHGDKCKLGIRSLWRVLDGGRKEEVTAG